MLPDIYIYIAYVVLRNRKNRQYFTKSFATISALKIESFRNFATIFKISAKIVISNFDKNENTGEHSICNFSTYYFGGQGNSSERWRNIAESFAKTLGKIGRMLRVKNFTKSATLSLCLYRLPV